MRMTVVVVLLALAASTVEAQWTHRYPKMQGYRHQVYLEGYELPTLNVGPTDPAVSPDGNQVAFSARGWIWTLDVATGRAARITSGAGMDFRPTWSPDGERIAFVRDDTFDTSVIVHTLATGAEATIDTPAVDLDPVFLPDGSLLYASAVEGALDLWRSPDGIDTGAPVTARRGIELKPSVSSDGSSLVYLHKGGGDRLVLHDLATGAERELISEQIVSQTRPAVSPDGRSVVYNWPDQDGYELRLLATSDPSTSLRLTRGTRELPLAPTFSPDGEWIWFTEAGDDEVMRLYRIRAVGGPVEEIPILVWDWGEATGRLRITTENKDTLAPSRLVVTDGSGHPVVPSTGYAQFALAHGRVFFYSPGVIELVLPAGSAEVSAVQGLLTPETTESVSVTAGAVTEITLDLEPVWNSRAAGYLSADHHFHLNYGGPYRLTPDDLVPMMQGESLDVATPQLANLHNRFEDQSLWGRNRTVEPPLIQFAQEVRSHFLGHVALLDTTDLFWPWIWGPGYQVYGTADRPNSEALDFAREQGGLGGYVHPVNDRDPFAGDGPDGVPPLLAADGILRNTDWLEVACLWTDELGTAEVWYRLLNFGVPIVLEAGTDVMTNFYRTMAVGATRLYVDTNGATNLTAYWRGMAEGRSFVSSGPILELEMSGARPGDALSKGGATSFELELHSAVPVETVELLVNGAVVYTSDGLDAAGSRSYEGTVDLPAGGWVAARAHGGQTVWPAMDSYPFAHTSPIWIGQIGSTDRQARFEAAGELGLLLDSAESRIVERYQGRENAERILATLAAAREKLQQATP